MRTIKNILWTSSVATALLLAMTASAFAQATGGGGPGAGMPGGAHRGLLKLQGTIVCAGCSLEEAQKAHPELNNLYEFRHDRGSVVLEVSAVNNSNAGDSTPDQEVSGRWADIAKPPQLAVRAQDNVYQQLTDPANRMKKVEITGLLHTTRTLDIQDITILG